MYQLNSFASHKRLTLLKRNFCHLKSFFFLTVAILLNTSHAQDYPKQTIKLIVGFPAGGPADIAARIISKGLQDTLKQPVIVENKTGASGDVASKYVAASNPDGYTILIATASFTLNPLISNSAGYDCLKDFTTVSMLANQANAIAVSTNLNISSFAELKALAGKKKLSVATSGVGTSSHITAAHLFNVLWNGDFTMVPYRGAGPAGMAVASGESDIGFMTVTGVTIVSHFFPVFRPWVNSITINMRHHGRPCLFLQLRQHQLLKNFLMSIKYSSKSQKFSNNLPHKP